MGTTFSTESATVNRQIIVGGIAPCKSCVVLMIRCTLVVGIVDTLLCHLVRHAFFLRGKAYTLLYVAMKENRYQVRPLAEYMIAASSYDNAVLAAYHLVKGMAEP